MDAITGLILVEPDDHGTAPEKPRRTRPVGADVGARGEAEHVDGLRGAAVRLKVLRQPSHADGGILPRIRISCEVRFGIHPAERTPSIESCLLDQLRELIN